MSSENPVQFRFAYLEAYWLDIKGEYQESERITLLMNENSLRTLGPYHQITVEAFALLGWLLDLYRVDRCLEPGNLLRYNTYGSRTYGPSKTLILFSKMDKLMYNLQISEKFEGYSSCKYALQQVELIFGKKHYWFFRFQFDMAIALDKLGRLSGSSWFSAR